MDSPCFYFLLLLVAGIPLGLHGRAVPGCAKFRKNKNITDSSGKNSTNAVTHLKNGRRSCAKFVESVHLQCVNDSLRRTKRDAADGWQATLTEEERGGLDTILVKNLDLSPTVTNQLVELDIVKDARLVSSISGRKKRNSVTSAEKLWPYGIVPYLIATSMSQTMRNLINGAIEEYHQLTCLRFVPREASDTDYIFFTPGQGCSSNIGRQAGKLSITLDSYCGHGVIVHEIAHAIGIYHEHTRPDRDDYVLIVWGNVRPTAADQFDKQNPQEVTSYGKPYDYDSLMHYSKLAYTWFGGVTIVPRMEDIHELGQKVRLSPGDIDQVKHLYNCGSKMQQNYEVTFDHLQHSHFSGQTFFIKHGEKCLAVPSTRDFDPRMIRYHNHKGLYPAIVVDCDSESSSQLWYRSKHFIVNVDTNLCLGLLFEYGVLYEIVALQTCKDGFFDQTWYCTGNFIRDATNFSCLGARDLDEQARRRKRRETNGFATLDLGRDDIKSQKHSVKGGIQPRSVTSNDNIMKLVMEFCSPDNEGIKWTFFDPTGSVDHSEICSGNPYIARRCYPADMHPATLSGMKIVRCHGQGYFVAGFFHTFNFEDSNNRNDRNSGLISSLKCCIDSVSNGEQNSGGEEEECNQLKWWDGNTEGNQFLITKGWVFCPHGMYLKGMSFMTADYSVNKNIIVDVECCRPANGPLLYEHCYQEGTSQVVDTMVHACRLDGYYITGVERKNCNQDKIECEEVLTCCRG